MRKSCDRRESSGCPPHLGRWRRTLFLRAFVTPRVPKPTRRSPRDTFRLRPSMRPTVSRRRWRRRRNEPEPGERLRLLIPSSSHTVSIAEYRVSSLPQSDICSSRSSIWRTTHGDPERAGAHVTDHRRTFPVRRAYSNAGPARRKCRVLHLQPRHLFVQCAAARDHLPSQHGRPASQTVSWPGSLPLGSAAEADNLFLPICHRIHLGTTRTAFGRNGLDLSECVEVGRPGSSHAGLRQGRGARAWTCTLLRQDRPAPCVKQDPCQYPPGVGEAVPLPGKTDGSRSAAVSRTTRKPEDVVSVSIEALGPASSLSTR
jgi:hypothetical protein